VRNLVSLYRVQTPFWMSVRMSVIYISILSFDARKKIIGALERIIPCQEFCVADFLIFVYELRYLGSNFTRSAEAFKLTKRHH